MTGSAAWLLSGLLLAHFLGDYTPLASAPIQRAKAVGKPVLPILAHALVHGCLVGVVLVAVARVGMPLLATAFALELVTHFLLDWGRGLLGARNPALSNPQGQLFWTVLGLDQMAHGLVLVWIAYLAL